MAVGLDIAPPDRSNPGKLGIGVIRERFFSVKNNGSADKLYQISQQVYGINHVLYS
jgi:hypothetical protein